MISTGAGVVDADYRGTLFVLLFNHSDKDFIGLFFLQRNWSSVNPVVSSGGR